VSRSGNDSASLVVSRAKLRQLERYERRRLSTLTTLQGTWPVAWRVETTHRYSVLTTYCQCTTGVHVTAEHSTYVSSAAAAVTDICHRWCINSLY